MLRGAQGTASVTARAVVNATGPWVSEFVGRATPVRAAHQVRLVKGSHIVVPRLFDHRFAYIFQNEDRRIVFAIPYEHEFTLLGTTDVDYHADPAAVRIDADEIGYLCALANRYFRQQIAPADVVWSYSGVRPLLQDESSDPMSVTRDYALELDREPAPLLSVFGGKITTYRKLSEDAVDLLAGVLGTRAPPWTATALLPGGDMPEGSFGAFLRALERRYRWLPGPLRRRYAHAYGTRLERVLGPATQLKDLGAEILPQLYERELEYLCHEEFALAAEDILWRRTKLGLHLLQHRHCAPGALARAARAHRAAGRPRRGGRLSIAPGGPGAQRRLALLIVVALAPLWLIGIFGRALWTPDEPREADIAWRMSQQSDRTLPELAGVPFLEKPPLSYWMSAAGIRAFGDSAGAARAANLLYALVTALAIGAIALAMQLETPQALVAALVAGSALTAFRVQSWLAPDACSPGRQCARALRGVARLHRTPRTREVIRLHTHARGRRDRLHGQERPGMARAGAGPSHPHRVGAALGGAAPRGAVCGLGAAGARDRTLGAERGTRTRGRRRPAHALLEQPRRALRPHRGAAGARLRARPPQCAGKIPPRTAAVPAALDAHRGRRAGTRLAAVACAGRRRDRLALRARCQPAAARAAVARGDRARYLCGAGAARPGRARGAVVAGWRSAPRRAWMHCALQGRPGWSCCWAPRSSAHSPCWRSRAPRPGPQRLQPRAASCCSAALRCDCGARARARGALAESLTLTYAAYAAAVCLSALVAFPVIDRWQDLGALARQIRIDTRAQPLALLAPDETTLAMIDHGVSGAYSVLATDDRSGVQRWFAARGAQARVLVLLPGHAAGAVSRWLSRWHTFPAPGDGTAGALIDAGAARLVQRYELPQGRRYALLGPPGT